MKRYALEIYAPGRHGEDVVCVIESDQPFAAIQRGDLLNPRTWPSGSFEAAQPSSRKPPHGALLRVTGVEHFIIQKDSSFSQHKLGVFTEAVDDVAQSRPDGGFTLTKIERWILANQYRILEKLYPDEAKYLAEAREAIESGYELHYGLCCEHLYDGFRVWECREVIDILSMFSALKHSFEGLDDRSGIDHHWVRFPGFDGNYETGQMAYARYFCEHDHGRFEDLEIKDFNSHAPLLGKYRAMLKEWKRSADENHLTKDDLIRITSARATGE